MSRHTSGGLPCLAVRLVIMVVLIMQGVLPAISASVGSGRVRRHSVDYYDEDYFNADHYDEDYHGVDGVTPNLAPALYAGDKANRPSAGAVFTKDGHRPPVVHFPLSNIYGTFGFNNNNPFSFGNNRPHSFGNNHPHSFGNNRPHSFGNNRPHSFDNNRPHSLGNNRPHSFGNNRPHSFDNGRPN